MSGAADALLALIGQTIGAAKGAKTANGGAASAQAKGNPFAALLNAATAPAETAQIAPTNKAAAAANAAAQKAGHAAAHDAKKSAAHAAETEGAAQGAKLVKSAKATQDAETATDAVAAIAATQPPAQTPIIAAKTQPQPGSRAAAPAATPAGTQNAGAAIPAGPTAEGQVQAQAQAQSAPLAPHAEKKNGGARVPSDAPLPTDTPVTAKPHAGQKSALVGDGELALSSKQPKGAPGTHTDKAAPTLVPNANANAASQSPTGREKPSANGSSAAPATGLPAASIAAPTDTSALFRAEAPGVPPASLMAARLSEAPALAAPQGLAQHQTATLAQPAHMLALAIAQRAQSGATQFEIRMDPPELGRVDVHLHVSRDGDASATLTVEKPETLDLLARDQKTLQRALAELGLNVDGGALNFRLRDGAAQNTGQDGGHTTAGDASDDDAATAQLVTTSAAGWTSSGLLDLQI